MYEVIRTGTQLDQLATLADEIWHEYFATLFDPDTLDYVIQTIQSREAISKQIAEGYVYCFIQHEGLAVGYFAYRASNTEQVLLLSKIYIRSSMRRMGLGRKAIDHLAKYCEDHKLKRICLDVHQENEPAIRSYQRIGFTNTGPMQRDLGRGVIIREYKMEKKIQ